MRAGALDRRILIQRPEQTQDEHGQPVVVWTLFADVAAEVRPLRGVERFTAQQVAADIDTVFRIRWLPGISPVMRVLYDGRVYDIKAAPEIGRRDGLEIHAKARAE